ncbi:hypothetical protein MMC19_003538 [Ptychographa xylographoides]|nr:hypothetical protein [Ptychographa xylographoides]
MDIERDGLAGDVGAESEGTGPVVEDARLEDGVDGETDAGFEGAGESGDGRVPVPVVGDGCEAETEGDVAVAGGADEGGGGEGCGRPFELVVPEGEAVFDDGHGEVVQRGVGPVGADGWRGGGEVVLGQGVRRVVPFGEERRWWREGEGGEIAQGICGTVGLEWVGGYGVVMEEEERDEEAESEDGREGVGVE